MKTLSGSRNTQALMRFSVFLFLAALIAGMAGCTYNPPPSQNLEIRTWYDLNATRNSLDGHHTLMNGLNSTSPGYEELASPTANGGRGWEPIGTENDPFTGAFDGQGYEIRDLFINRPSENHIGLFGSVQITGVLQDIGVANFTVIGKNDVGGLAGAIHFGTVSNSYATGSVTGGSNVGGLVGWNHHATIGNSYTSGDVTGTVQAGGLVGWNDFGTVSNSSSTASVTGSWDVGALVGVNGGTIIDSHSSGAVTGSTLVGGLVGRSHGTVSNCYSSGNVTGSQWLGGLVGENYGIVSNSYSTGSVTGNEHVGGLVGWNGGILSNSYYNYDETLVNGKNMISVGALFDGDFKEWLANGQFLDVDERLSQEDGYHILNNVSDFKQLLAFGQNATLKFRLTSDLNLAAEPGFHVPYLAGTFDGKGHTISNVSLNSDSVSPLGLFGFLTPGAKVTQIRAENVTITGDSWVGGLVGLNGGTIIDSYSSGNLTGTDRVGGLVGWNYDGTVSNSYCSGSVTGDYNVGGLVGWNYHATIDSSYASGNVTGDSSVGGLVGGTEYGTVRNSYSSGNATGYSDVGGLVGWRWGGTVSNSYSTGNVTGGISAGGLVGTNAGNVNNSFWDIETSGQSTSAGGMGKNTTEMQDIVTFSGADWNIIAVAVNETNLAYIWNIVDNVTYPFLSWQT